MTEHRAGGGLVEFTSAAGLRWTAEPGHAEAVRDVVASRIDALESIPGAAVLKRNLVRTVLRVPFGTGPDERVIVKRYRVSGAGDWAKYAVKRSRARAEWDVGRGLNAAGIATAVPIAYAERRSGGILRDAALVTREIRDSVHLNAFVEAHLTGDAEPARSRRAALYDDLARLVRRMHEAGFVHNDLHGGNVLVNGTPAAPRLHVIDLHSVTHSAQPSESSRWFDLVKLLHSMLTCSSEEERVRICRVYEETGGPSGVRVAGLLASGTLSARVEPELAAMELRRVRSRTERSLGVSSKFDVTTSGPYRVHHLRTADPSAIVALLPLHAAAVAAAADSTQGRRARAILKDGRRSAITRQTLTEGSKVRTVVVKQYRGDSPIDRAKNLLRMPRAMSAWAAGHGLIVRGFAAAEPIALVLRGRGVSLREAYVVMEDLGDGTRADLVALSRWAGPLDAAARREKSALVAAAARLLRRLHDAGVYHADFKAVNLFVAGPPGEGRLVLADYDRVEFDRRVPRRRRAKNLAQLSASVAVCVSLADRLRFFREYASGDPEVLASWKAWFRRVSALCRSKIVVRMDPIE